MRPALHHRQVLTSLMTLMFLLVRGLVDLMDLRHLLDRQIPLDFRKAGLQLLHLLVSERESKSGKCIA